LREELDRGLLSLPFEQRTVFVLYELEGFTLPQIGEALGIPLGTATSRLRRARANFEAWVESRAGEWP
ncbi:MAG TPA: sigma factor-like helix-turn-helix DNA-binding protein, partial [Polyangiaceae bacterium]|nr:sigma factor-like helix-turn-helix DNA-binding protein [Polyangiaceae bacterium]